MITLYKTDILKLIALLERSATTIEGLSQKNRDWETSRLCKVMRKSIIKKVAKAQKLKGLT